SEAPRVEVNVLDRLPTPWGLVRLGVAPDHENIKAVSRAIAKTAAREGFRFFGNVEVGSTVSHEELLRIYDAVVYTVGAQTDRRLGIPGEDLPGSWAATEFVAWYNGHPDFQDREFDLSHERVVVVGNGNVAIDCARMLALAEDELRPTDTTQEATDAINAAGVREILMLGRRGPVQAAFTPPELKELGELAGADVIANAAELELDPAGGAGAAERGLQGRRTPRRPVRRAQRDDPERPGACGGRRAHVRRGLDQARPVGRDRHEQEGRDGDRPAPARGCARRKARS